jgi:gliding motility-associated-like protein
VQNQFRIAPNFIFIIFLSFFFIESPYAQIIIPAKEFQICPGATTKVSITVAPSAPAFFELYHKESKVTYTFSSETENSFQISLTASGTYIITNYGSHGDTIVNNTDSIIISYLSNLSMKLEGGGNYCNSLSPVPISATFTGAAPFTYKFLINNNLDSIITNNNTYTFGTSQYIEIFSVQVGDKYCSMPVSESASYKSVMVPVPTIIGSPYSCFPGTAIFTTENSPLSYNWQILAKARNIIHTRGKGQTISVQWDEPGEYGIQLQLIDSLNNCVGDWNNLPVIVYPAPQVSTNIDTSACVSSDKPLLISIFTNEGETIYWPHQNITSPTIILYKEGSYNYYLIDGHQCSDTGVISVTNKCVTSLFVPEAFTPNGDNINDSFEVFGTYINLEFQIYSPSGQLLFTMFKDGPFWDGNFDGKELPNGVYYWFAKYSDTSGNHSMHGAVTLIR